MDPTTRFSAVCLQTNINVVNEFDPDPTHAETQVKKNLARQVELLDWLFLDQRIGGPKLITFSEFCLTGVPESRKVEDYLRRSVYMPGWVTETLGAKAKEHDCYIACNTFERDDDFPGMVFNTSFLMGPDGEIALKYRKNNNAQGGTAKNTNPGDIYDDYCATVGDGPESLFPIVETPLGKIALVTCFDMRFPELVRSMALRGAEIVIHLTAEASGQKGTWTTSKQVRCWDNQVYMLACNNGDTLNSKRPLNRQWGSSRIIDWTGRIVAEALNSGETIVTANLDMDALRRSRSNGTRNPIASNRYWMYADYFEDPDKQTWPLNSFSKENPYETSDQMKAIGKTTIDKLYDRGTLVRPGTRDRVALPFETPLAPRNDDGRKYLERYGVACLQTDVHGFRNHEINPGKVEENTKAALERNTELIDWVCQEPRYAPKLICLSEFHLTGVPETRTLEDYLTISTELPGMVTEAYGTKAKEYGVYVVAGVFEKDADWPGRMFNSAFLIGPDGNILLKYRKNNDFQVSTPCSTNTGDMYDAYKEHYGGIESFFPVVDTELGRIGLMICYDISMAEVPRMLALNGAEVIVHPTAEASGGGAGASWQLAKQTRAYDNASYFISINNGDTLGSARPRNRQRAGSTKVINYEGEIIAECENEGESVIQSQIDLEALRQFRSNANRNPMAISRFETYAPIYRNFEGWPKNAFSETPLEGRDQAKILAKQSVDRLYEKGILTPPTGVKGPEPAHILRD